MHTSHTFNTNTKENYILWQSWFHSRSIWSVSIMCHINRFKDSYRTILSTDVIYQSSHPFIKTKPKPKTSTKSGSRRSLPQHNRDYVWQTCVQHYPKSAEKESICSKIRNKTRVLVLHTLIQDNVQTLSLSHNMRNKDTNRKGKIKLSLFAGGMLLYWMT